MRARCVPAPHRRLDALVCAEPVVRGRRDDRLHGARRHFGRGCERVGANEFITNTILFIFGGVVILYVLDLYVFDLYVLNNLCFVFSRGLAPRAAGIAVF